MAAAERMKAMRDRRRSHGLREVRLVLPDARIKDVQRRIAQEAARLSPKAEQEALEWIEAVSDFETDEAR